MLIPLPCHSDSSNCCRAAGGGSIDHARQYRPIIIQVPLQIAGREVAYATATYDSDQARRYGLPA